LDFFLCPFQCHFALDNPAAVQKLAHRVFEHADQLEAFPDSGSNPPELKGWAYGQIVEPPCRVFYRHERQVVYILHVIRSEHRLRRTRLVKSDAPE